MGYKLITEATFETVKSGSVLESTTTDGSTAPLRKYYIEGIFAQSQVKNKNGRWYPENVLDEATNNYINDHVNTHSALGEMCHPLCFRDDTKILTTDGIKLIKDLTIGELVYSYNIESNDIEEVPVTKVINEPYMGEMIHIKGKNIDTLVTPKHEFLVIKKNKQFKITAQELMEAYERNDRSYSHVRLPRVIGEYSNSSDVDFVELFATPKKGTKEIFEKYSKPFHLNKELFAALVGIVLSEGGLAKKSISISQKLGPKSDKIQILMDKLSETGINITKRTKGTKNVWILYDLRLNTEFQKLGTNCYDKHIPPEYKKWDKKYLEILFDWFCLGDGRGNRQAPNMAQCCNIFSTSKQMIDDFVDIAFKIGRSFSLYHEDSSKKEGGYWFAGHFIKYKNKKPLYFMNLCRSETIWIFSKFISITREQYSGNVVCIQNKNQNFYALTNVNGRLKGFWTGNSPEVNPDRACHLVESLVKRGTDWYGRAKVLQTQERGKALMGMIDEGVAVGVSTRCLGAVNEENGMDIVQPGLHMSAIDAVLNPSAPKAYVRGMLEGKEWVWNGNLLVECIVSKHKKIVETMRPVTQKALTERESIRLLAEFFKSLN